MKIIKLLYKQILNLFVSFFRIINENSQINVLNSISKDSEGYTIIYISSLTSLKPYPIYPHQIIKNPYLKNQFRKSDIKIIESIIISEGDIFIAEKEYQGNNTHIALRSIINNQTWKLSQEQIMNDLCILNRINKRFFDYKNKAFKHGLS